MNQGPGVSCFPSKRKLLLEQRDFRHRDDQGKLLRFWKNQAPCHSKIHLVKKSCSRQDLYHCSAAVRWDARSYIANALFNRIRKLSIQGCDDLWAILLCHLAWCFGPVRVVWCSQVDPPTLLQHPWGWMPVLRLMMGFGFDSESGSRM